MPDVLDVPANLDTTGPSTVVSTRIKLAAHGRLGLAAAQLGETPAGFTRRAVLDALDALDTTAAEPHAAAYV